MSSEEQQAPTGPSPPTTMASSSYVIYVPTEPGARDTFLADEGKKIMRTYMFKCSVDKNGRPTKRAKDLTPEEEEEINMILLAFSDIEGLTKVTANKISMKRVLDVVLDRVDPKFKLNTRFPATAVEIAQQAFDRYMSRYDPNNEGKEWGADPENILLDVENRGSLSPAPASKKRRRSSSATDEPPPKRVTRAPENHPIYGKGGLMDGILVQHGQRKSYVFDPNFKRPNFVVFGHNGLTVGQWWANQKAAHRDGAHGMDQAGISGTPADGAHSIVVSAGYEGLDRDMGNVLYYSGSGTTNRDPNNAVLTSDTQALRTSFERNLPIRVIRSFKSEWKHAPPIGCRYDGLYKIVEEDVHAINKHGGAYIRFKLRRLANQPAYDLSRPTAQERRDHARIQDYY